MSTQKTNNLYNNNNAIIFSTILIINIIGFFLINWSLNNISYISLALTWLFSTAQSVIVIILINKIYEKPLIFLEKEIYKFIKWKDKKQEFSSEKTWNPHLDFITTFLSKSIKSLSHIKEDFIHGKSIKSEVQLATELQEKVLNKKMQTIPSIDIVAKSKPAWEVGWDSYDIIKQEDNYYVYVADATGHWVWAWFVMIMVNALIMAFSKIYASWAQIVANTNEVLKPRVKSNILMSLLMIRWNEKEKRLFMTWAWHEYLMIYKHSRKKCFRIKSWWVALWMAKNIHKICKEKEIAFEENDIIVLYTDWITEAINRPKKDGTEKMFLEDRLVETIENSANFLNNWVEIKTAQSVFNNVTIELSKFMGYKYAQLDDVTLVCCHYRWDNKIENDISPEISDDYITEWSWTSVNKKNH